MSFGHWYTRQHLRIFKEVMKKMSDEKSYQADGTPIHRAADGTLRKSRYGAGKQPWDDIVDAGWGPAFAAGNVLKNLRRDKEPKHSLESAQWYYARLKERADEEICNPQDEREWWDAIDHLHFLLTDEEIMKLA